jgi:phosphotransferase system HPr (HPr) family protein
MDSIGLITTLEATLTTSKEIFVQHKVGLHARPAAMFVKIANKYTSNITVENLCSQTGPVNAKSILGILSSGVEMNHQIQITAEGEDEDEALKALCELIETNFGEGD